MADLNHLEQDSHTGCQACTRRSDWDFLKAFYQREEMAKNQIQGLNGHIVQLNSALHHAGTNAQKERAALNRAHQHMDELQATLNQSDGARARLENELNEERQNHLACQESLKYECIRHTQTDRSLDCIWNSHNKLGEILSRVEYDLDSNVQSTSRMRYNITDLVLELAAKAQRIDKLETTLEEKKQEHDTEVHELKEKLRVESEQHTEESMNQSRHITLLLQREHLKPSIGENFGQRQESKPTKRRRRFRGRSRANEIASNSMEEALTGTEGVESCPVIKKESF